MSNSSLKFTVLTDGSFPGQPASRALNLRLVNAPPPQKVLHGKNELKFSEFGGAGTWRYDGDLVMLIIEAKPMKTDETQVIVVQFSEELASMWQSGKLAGLRGAIGHAILAKRRLDEIRMVPG